MSAYANRGAMHQRSLDPLAALADYRRALELAPPDWPQRAGLEQRVADLGSR